jgi:hypothetical protein
MDASGFSEAFFLHFAFFCAIVFWKMLAQYLGEKK